MTPFTSQSSAVRAQRMAFEVIQPIIYSLRKIILEHKLACFKTESVCPLQEHPPGEGKEGAAPEASAACPLLHHTPEEWASDIFLRNIFICLVSYANKLLPASPPIRLGLSFPKCKKRQTVLEETPRPLYFPPRDFKQTR